MNLEKFRSYCLAKKAVEESFPFDENVLAFKVKGKIFALTNISADEFVVNLKCDPERAEELRLFHPEDVLPGYHMNKKHWNSVHFEQNLNSPFLKDLIDHSYDLVVAKLPKKDRIALEAS